MTQDPNDSFFKQALPNRDKSQDQRARDRLAVLTEQVIKRTLTQCGFEAVNWKGLTNDCRDRYGGAYLSLEWFHDEFPTFPFRLGCSNVPWSHDLTLRILMDGFLKTKLFTAYKQFLLANQLDDRTQQVAFVFRETQRLMVLHNNPRIHDISDPDNTKHRGTMVVHLFEGATYCLEIYDKFLAAVGPGWLQDRT
jgi:hypothetical protein